MNLTFFGLNEPTEWFFFTLRHTIFDSASELRLRIWMRHSCLSDHGHGDSNVTGWQCWGASLALKGPGFFMVIDPPLLCGGCVCVCVCVCECERDNVYSSAGNSAQILCFRSHAHCCLALRSRGLLVNWQQKLGAAAIAARDVQKMSAAVPVLLEKHAYPYASILTCEYT